MRQILRLSRSDWQRNSKKEKVKLKEAIQRYLEKHGFGQFCPKAVLFDMDGVIYNSMPNHAYSWHKTMASIGIDMTEDEAYQYEGMRGVETIKLKARQQWHAYSGQTGLQHSFLQQGCV